MHLFSASSLFTEENIKSISEIADNREKLMEKDIEIKKQLLELYHFKWYNLPDDFQKNSYIIATNHLTDSDAPLLLSFYYEVMHTVLQGYPQLFVFAKENCFNGVSIPKEILPVMELEKVMPVNRSSSFGAVETLKKAKKWFQEGEKPKHFLIFAQGTIYDINKDVPEDIEDGTFWLAKSLGIPVLPAFLEQAVEGEVNRIVFGEPISVPKSCRDYAPYKKLWIEKVIEAENSFEKVTGRKARETVLDDEHKVRKYHAHQ
ncbi:MAG: lysophospholipid acyltransferase family protein [Oscillospiraceae bacterium]